MVETLTKALKEGKLGFEEIQEIEKVIEYFKFDKIYSPDTSAEELWSLYRLVGCRDYSEWDGEDGDDYFSIATHPNCPSDLLHAFAQSGQSVLEVIKHPNVEPRTLEFLAHAHFRSYDEEDEEQGDWSHTWEWVKEAVAENPKTPARTKKFLAENPDYQGDDVIPFIGMI